MKLTGDEIKEAMAIQKKIEGKIATYQKEISMLERTWKIIDGVIAESSFTSAADMLGEGQKNRDVPEDVPAKTDHNTQSDRDGATDSEHNDNDATAATAGPAPTPILDSGTGKTIANAYKTGGDLCIKMTHDGSKLTADIPPFRSFFIERILEGMQKKDAEDIQNGVISAQSAISYSIEADPETNHIRDILIRNYRDEKRASELINTAGWTFARMLEKGNR